MLKGLILGILFLGISSTAYAQNVEIVKDLRPGPLTGFLQSFSSYNGELFFTGTDEGPAFNEVFSVNEDLTITKRLSANTIRGASIIESTEDYLYIYNREGTQDRELYRSTGSNNSLNLIVEFDNDINQSTSLSNGVVFIEEDQERNKKVHYISDDASSSAVIIEEINLGQYDLEITETESHIVLSPFDYDDYEGGVIAFDKASSTLDSNYLNNLCLDIKYAYGFGSQLLYSCGDEYFIYDFPSMLF